VSRATTSWDYQPLVSGFAPPSERRCAPFEARKRVAVSSEVVFTDASWNPTEPAEVDATSASLKSREMQSVIQTAVAWQIPVLATCMISAAFAPAGKWMLPS